MCGVPKYFVRQSLADTDGKSNLRPSCHRNVKSLGRSRVGRISNLRGRQRFVYADLLRPQHTVADREGAASRRL
jgi:hypothetical protein